MWLTELFGSQGVEELVLLACCLHNHDCVVNSYCVTTWEIYARRRIHIGILLLLLL